MAKELQESGLETGVADYYFRLRDESGQYWNNDAAAFETYNASNIALYGADAGSSTPYQEMTEVGATGTYTGDIAAPAGVYQYEICEQAGAAPVEGDLIVASGRVDTATVALLSGIPTTAEFNARTLPASNYFDPANHDVAVVTLVNSLDSTAVDAIWDAATAGLTTAGSIGKKLADWVVGVLHADYDAAKTAATQASVNTALSNQATIAGYIDSEVGHLIDLLEADRYIDTSPTPWQLVLVKKGTGALGVGTELLRQDLKDEGAADITAISDFVGQQVSP